MQVFQHKVGRTTTNTAFEVEYNSVIALFADWQTFLISHNNLLIVPCDVEDSWIIGETSRSRGSGRNLLVFSLKKCENFVCHAVHTFLVICDIVPL